MVEKQGQAWTAEQSKMLKRVDLRVSMKTYKHFKMLGTETRQKNGVYQDPCAGDSGGPLMYQDRSSGRWVLIGQHIYLSVEKTDFHSQKFLPR